MCAMCVCEYGRRAQPPYVDPDARSRAERVGDSRQRRADQQELERDRHPRGSAAPELQLSEIAEPQLSFFHRDYARSQAEDLMEYSARSFALSLSGAPVPPAMADVRACKRAVHCW